jgi:hypothetical protein
MSDPKQLPVLYCSRLESALLRGVAPKVYLVKAALAAIENPPPSAFTVIRGWWAHQASNLGPSDYEGKLKGRRYRVFPGRRPFFCPALPWVSTVSMGLRRGCVDDLSWTRRIGVVNAGLEVGSVLL